MSIKNKINEFLISKGFNLIEEDVSEYFGDFYSIYSNEIINVRFVSDRSIESIDVNNVQDVDRWIDLALIKALINDEQDLSKVITVNEYNDFLEKHFFKVCELLSLQNYSSTKKKVEILESKRVKQMFPSSPKSSKG
jgi:glutathionylspermidine synthase